MPKRTRMFGLAILAALAAAPLLAQTEGGEPDPLIESVQDAASYVRDMLTKAADQMSEEDYAFKPTADVRTFGQLLAHVADSNYGFCSAARGEKRPVADVEKTRTNRDDIRKVLSESFAYCDGAYAAMTDTTQAKTVVDFMGKRRPRLAVLMFRTNHSLLHYGNVVTYMRLRGKVPPSSAPRPEK